LPLDFLRIALKSNPGTEVFSWGSTRKEIEEEIRVRTAQEREDAAAALLKERSDKIKEENSRLIDSLPDELRASSRMNPSKFRPAGKNEQKAITVLIFTSHIRSHPDPWVTDNVYRSIREHLPFSRIVVLCDGKDTDEPWEYREYKHRLLVSGKEIVRFKGWQHQTLMLKRALMTEDFITTPLVMVTEHDWGIRRRFVDWDAIVRALLDERFGFRLVQLRQNEAASWEYKFFGKLISRSGANFLPTTCFQCPMHIADVSWYRDIVRDLHIPDFLERAELGDIMMHKNYLDDMACYIPRGPMGRLYHLNGRDVLSPSEVGGICDA